MGKNKEQEVKAPPAPVEEVEIDLGIEVEDENLSPEEAAELDEILVEGPPMVANQDVLEGIEDEPEEVPVEAFLTKLVGFDLVEGPPMVANQDVLEGMSAGTILDAVKNTFGAAGLQTLRTSVAQRLRIAREKKERAENFSARKTNKR